MADAEEPKTLEILFVAMEKLQAAVARQNSTCELLISSDRNLLVMLEALQEKVRVLEEHLDNPEQLAI